jgi:hypothetical protein
MLIWNGTTWVVPNAPAQNPTGLELVTTATCSSGGSASGGVVTIGSAISSVVIGNAFSAIYDNYKIMITGGVSSGGSDLSFQLSGITTSSYQISGYYMTPGSSTLTGYSPSVATSWLLGSTNATRYAHTFDVINPFASQQKFMIGMNGLSSTGVYSFSGHCTSTSSATGFTLIPNGGTTLTGGNVRIYGYRNS